MMQMLSGLSFQQCGKHYGGDWPEGEAVRKYIYGSYGELLIGERDGSIRCLYNGQYGVTTDYNSLYYYSVDIKRFVNQGVLHRDVRTDQQSEPIRK